MADPISIIGLVGQAAHLLSRLYDYVQTVRSAKKEVYELYTEILALKGILEQINQRQPAAQEGNVGEWALESSQQYKDTLGATNVLLKSMLEDLTPRKDSKLASLTWARHKSSVLEQTTKVERAKSFFVLVLMNDASVSQQDIVALVKGISTSLALDRQEREQEKAYDKIRAWLAPFNPDSLHAKAGGNQQPGTGSWFLNGPFSMWLHGRDDQFREWCAQEREAAKRLKNGPEPTWGSQTRHPMDEDARFLFLAGPSGFGKTVLCASAVKMAKEAPGARDCTAYYYFSASYPNSQSPNAMLGSVLSQLCRQDDSVLAVLRSECDRGDVLDEKLLIQHIAQCCNSMSESYIFVDAINESTITKNVLVSLYRIMSQAKSVRIFVTSTEYMVRLSVYIQEVQANVYLRPAHINEDIRAYAMQRLEMDEPTCFLSSARKEQLATSLVTQAEGVFRYAACQLDSYSRMHTGREVIRAMNKMPEDLFKVYAESLSQVPRQDRDLVREALLWVMNVKQPLTLGALAEAVVLELEDTYMDAELRLANPREILTMCHGLLDHDQETAQVFLSHATIRDFLSSVPEDNVDVWYRPNTDSVGENDRRIFDKCMTYLMFDDFANVCADMAELNARRDRYPLLDYAVQAWPVHYPRDDAALASVIRLFASRTKNGGNYATWVQTLINDVPPKVALLTEPLYYAASFGLLPVVEHLVATGSSIDLPGGRALAPPLQVAVFRDNTRVVEFLLKNGADPNSKNADGLTNMECARLRDNWQVEYLLQKHGAAEPDENKAPDPMGRAFDRWAKCCQCGGDFVWGSAMYGACGMCTHKMCVDCRNVAKKR
ncbi:hypothetical protein ONS96_001721 [Cadophora gregata f. sp. sojae]|nr:hypothetical protein ONS96_001721 [Cadophora gregata f. sp. sojae]